MKLQGIVCACVLIALAIAPVAAQPTPADGFEGIWYEITSNRGDLPNKYGGGMATYPQQHAPIAIYSSAANKTFFTYGGRDPDGGDLQHVMSYFDHETGMVARPQVWLDKSDQGEWTRDAHDNPTLAIDGDGFVYQFSNVHGNDPRRSFIRRSAEPFEINAFDGLLSAHDANDRAVFGDDNGEVRFSYGNPWYLPARDSFLFLFTRYSGQDREVYFSGSDNADDWAPRQPLLNMERGQYTTSWIKPDGETVGVIFNAHPRSGPTGSGNDARTNLYYLETNDLGRTWRNAAGDQVSIPLTDSINDGRVFDYQSLGRNVYIKDVNFTSDGSPVIMYLTSGGPEPGPENGPREVTIARFDGSAWTKNTVTQTDHNYDHGSLYIDEDRWRVIAPFLDGPQAFGTGGEIGVWESIDDGETWRLVDQLTEASENNHSYIRRPLNAHNDFVALWADGNAFSPSSVSLFFADAEGNVYRLPEEIQGDFAKPILVREIPEPGTLASFVLVMGPLLCGRRVRSAKKFR